MFRVTLRLLCYTGYTELIRTANEWQTRTRVQHERLLQGRILLNKDAYELFEPLFRFERTIQRLTTPTNLPWYACHHCSVLKGFSTRLPEHKRQDNELQLTIVYLMVTYEMPSCSSDPFCAVGGQLDYHCTTRLSMPSASLGFNNQLVAVNTFLWFRKLVRRFVPRRSLQNTLKLNFTGLWVSSCDAIIVTSQPAQQY